MNEIKFFHIDQGLIQLVSNETFIMNNQRFLNFKVERLQISKGKARIYWRVVIQEFQDFPNTFGAVELEDGEIQKIYKVPFDLSIPDQPIRIELFNPTESYKLGKIKMAKISRVCK